MAIEGITIRPAKLDDLDAIANIYSTLWCNSLRDKGAFDDALLAARFNVCMQCQCSPIVVVAEKDGGVIGSCMVGAYDDGVPRTNPYWQATYDNLLAQATERAKTADENLEGSLFGDSREKATGNRFAATGNEYAHGQLNLIIIRPEWQGHGLGRALIDFAREQMRAEGIETFFLMTDNRSSYAFYDHLGMTRIAEDHSQDTGDNFIVYIYGDRA